MSFAACHTRRSTAAYLFKPAGCLRKSCSAIFDQSGRSADRSRRAKMAMDGGKSRISSQSVSDGLLLKTGGSRSLGGRSPVRVEEQLHRDLGRTSYPLRDV